MQSVQEKVESSLGSGDKATIHALWTKIKTLEQVLDPNFIKTTQMTQSSKEDLLLGYTGQIKAVSQQVEELQQLKDYVNTTEFQGLDSQEKQLNGIANMHNQQELKIEEIFQQAQKLVKAYNQIILQLSAQCVEWGEKLSQLESQ